VAAPFSLLQNKHATAMKSVLDGVSSTNRGGATVYIGLAGDVELSLPRIECEAEAAEEYPEFTGNFWVTTRVRVLSDANESITVHESRVGYVYDQIWSGALAADLSAALADYFCFGIRNRRILNSEKEDRHFVTAFEFEALCCPADS
jgi:hypothetical protein